MEIRTLTIDDPAYEDTWSLRCRVLLDPFDIDREAAKSDDAAATHLGLFEGPQCLACLLLVPRDPGVVQLRQVAVAQARQRTGLGRHLVRRAENLVRDEGFSLMRAHARHTALPFYLALDYQIIGKPFVEVGIEHHVVEKDLIGRS